MTDNLLRLEFEEVCKRLVSENDPTLSEEELEPSYEILLNFLIRNQHNRQEIIEFLNAIIRSFRSPQTINSRFFPGMAIAYCMHVLLWQEIYDFALAENKEFYSRKMQKGMADILNAYDDDWDDKDLYRRFDVNK
ncbi:hypothetical protein [Massilia sp. 9096]|uniref:hypothetical protein n=1 Tax=Massilia sp. 9096 TaxID=1500894 RepID=UPI00055FD87C|nr:hypothetical protein [Massilia sp. 9096]